MFGKVVILKERVVCVTDTPQQQEIDRKSYEEFRERFAEELKLLATTQILDSSIS